MYVCMLLEDARCNLHVVKTFITIRSCTLWFQDAIFVPNLQCCQISFKPRILLTGLHTGVHEYTCMQGQPFQLQLKIDTCMRGDSSFSCYPATENPDCSKPFKTFQCSKGCSGFPPIWIVLHVHYYICCG